MTSSLVERKAPDDLWELFERAVPSAPGRPQGRGRQRHGEREVLAAIIFVATSGCTWNQLSPSFGPSGVTAFRRFTEWTEARVSAKLRRLVLDELGTQGGWTGHGAPSTPSASGPRRGQLTGPDPAGRGNNGSKIHLIVDRNGLPLPPVRSRCSPWRRRPATLHGDKGYDCLHLRH